MVISAEAVQISHNFHDGKIMLHNCFGTILKLLHQCQNRMLDILTHTNAYRLEYGIHINILKLCRRLLPLRCYILNIDRTSGSIYYPIGQRLSCALIGLPYRQQFPAHLADSYSYNRPQKAVCPSAEPVAVIRKPLNAVLTLKIKNQDDIPKISKIPVIPSCAQSLLNLPLHRHGKQQRGHAIWNMILRCVHDCTAVIRSRQRNLIITQKFADLAFKNTSLNKRTEKVNTQRRKGICIVLLQLDNIKLLLSFLIENTLKAA